MNSSLRQSSRALRSESRNASARRIAKRSLAAPLAAMCCIIGLGGAGVFQGKKTTPTSSTQLAEEKGKFRILLDGQLMGSEEFEISRAGSEWAARGSTEIRVPGSAEAAGGNAGPGGSTRVVGKMQLTADGAPRRYEWTSQAQKKASATVEFEGAKAKMVLQLQGAQPFVQELTFNSPRVIILDNNLYHHYAILARLYDWGAEGAQTFAVLIPQDMTPGSITVESLGAQQADGVSYDVLRVRSPDLEILLYLDGSRRLMRLAVPASKALILRE